MTFFGMITLGCKVNSYESEAVINELIEKGWTYKEEAIDCDVVIINTCTVTQTSDQKSRQMINGARRNNPNAIICAMGCFVQLNEKAASEIADVIIGTNNRLSVYELVNSYLESKQAIDAVTDVLHAPSYEELKINRLQTHTRAFIKIQDGCENYCSYCAIPYSRGRIRSRNNDNIIEEINHLVENGTKEVIFAGINTGTYGKDLKDINLAKLIEQVMTKTSLHRLRISSIELMEITDELLDVLKKYESRICMHFHIPLQAGSDTVLKRMRRKYLTQEYLDVVTKIRQLFGNCAITTDILAGFVQETEEEFKECLEFIQKVGFADMHVFPYSRRKGTLADKMDGHLAPSTIKLHAKGITEVANKMKQSYIDSFMNENLEVLFECKKHDYWHGHTSNYLDVFVKCDDDLTNKLCLVKLEKNQNGIIYGNIIERIE